MQIYLYNSVFFCNFAPNYCVSMLRLSFIVPFYNAAPYIEECIRSLYDQDIPQEEYEVICVDDCSLDDSRAIVERLLIEYATLKLLVHEVNKRQGGARNTAMKVAQGRYIWFVDADDTIETNCVGQMLRKAEEDDLDLLKFHFGPLDAQQLKQKPYSRVITTGSELIFDVEKDSPLLSRCNSAVQQLTRREFLERNGICFEEGLQYEDDDYAYKIYAMAERVFLIQEAPYHVRVTPNSTTRRKHDLRRVRDIYAQAIRMESLDAELSKRDARWHTMVKQCIDDCINNCVFRMLRSCTRKEQIVFWCKYRKHVRRLKPYLSRKSYAKLSSFIIWKILQK